MKPTQKSILMLLDTKSCTSGELYTHHHEGKSGITVNWVGKQNWSKLHAWLNRHVKPLIRSGNVCRDVGRYKLTEKGIRVAGKL